MLRPLSNKRLNLIEATRALAKRGMTVAAAKRAVEAAVERGVAVALLPTVESVSALAGDLRKAGIEPRRVAAEVPVDVKALRTALSLTQEEFAVRYGLNKRTVEKWEAGGTINASANTYLHAIKSEPNAVAAALEQEVA